MRRCTKNSPSYYHYWEFDLVITVETSQGLHFTVDIEDEDLVKDYIWHINKGYVVRNTEWINGSRERLKLHRVIAERMGLNMSLFVDHIDRDCLNNCRDNLRNATTQQNCMNRSKIKNTSSIYKGVYWYKAYSLWKSHIRLNGKQICIGYFDDEIEAARAYDNAAIIHYGEYACLNFE